MRGANRGWAVVALLALALAAWAAPKHVNNILVLIQPAIAGPAVPQQNYWKPEQVLWPSEIGSGNGGRLLSVASGANWLGDMEAFRSKNYASIERHGYFDVRKAFLKGTQTALLVGRTGYESTNAQILALNDAYGEGKPYRVGDAWPAGRLMVAEARSWDEEKVFESSTTGRVLVVEYPPRLDRPWTRFWLDGNGWPPLPNTMSRGPVRAKARPVSDTSLDVVMAPEERDLPIPGLIRARMMIDLVVRPGDFRWVKVEQGTWPGASRFLDLGHEIYPWAQGAWMILVAIALIWGAADVINERSSRVLPLVLTAILLSPAIVDVAGLVGRYLGMDEWPVWILLSTYVLVAISAVLRAYARRRIPRAHALAMPFLVGLVTVCAIDPAWGLMTQILSLRVWYVSPVGLASLFGYLVGFVSCIHGCGTAWNWVGRTVCALFFVGGLAVGAWWTTDLGATIAMPVLALLIGEGRFRWPMHFALAVWPTSLVPLVTGGIVWSPDGLLINGSDIHGLNLFDHFEFMLMSPSLIVAILVGGGCALFGYKFLFHQMSMLRRMDRRRVALLQASVSAGALGLLHPIFLYGSLTLAAGGMSTMLFDAVQTM